MEPNRTVNENEKEPSDEEVLSYMRALAELIFEAWKESVNREKVLIPSEKTDVLA